ncbi:MAG TPA: CdaR family protein [Spirochaetia bacterium]|nr:CdaR family protein [Spirochaetia bacterium]
MRSRRLARTLLADLPVKVICLAAAVVLFLFHRVNTLTERFFSVPLEVTTPSGLAVASAFPKTVRITLRGAEEAIFPILEEDIEASVDLDTYRSAGIYQAQVKVNRKGTALNVEPLEINVDPGQITFTLEPLTERRVSVIPDIRGEPAYGYELVQSTVSPSSVAIRGARSRVQGVSAVPTEEIDLTGRTGSFASRVRILLPNALLRIAGDPSVDFKATIQESIVTRRFDAVPISTVDLSPHLTLRSPIPPGSVQVQGAQLVVDGVRPEQVRLVLDCSAVKRAGQYELHPRAEVPSSVTVPDFDPKVVTVEFVVSGG